MGDNMSEIINNFKNIINSDSSNSSSNQNSSENHSDFNITPEMISNLMSSFKRTSDSQEQSNNTFTNNIDFDTILKIKSIIESLNKKDDPKSNLLYSLKPYLRESRQKKIDQYVNLFKISQVTNIFKNEKGDKL